MKKAMKRVGICFLFVSFFWVGVLAADRSHLNEELIRLHVVANSDSTDDQTVKLQVKEAVVKSLQEAFENVSDVDEAKRWIAENLSMIQDIANETLSHSGSDDRAVVSLCQEAFDTRHYDTFTLPAGIYHALKIKIGNAEGKNWWCVAFPSLCIPVTADEFEATAAGAGFTETLSNALIQEEGYEVHFFLLDVMGRLENIFFAE